MATELNRQIRVFLHSKPTAAVLHPVAATHIWCQGCEQDDNKGRFPSRPTPRAEVQAGFPHTAISIKPWGNSDLYHSLGYAPVPDVTKGAAPRAKVKWYVSLFYDVD